MISYIERPPDSKNYNIRRNPREASWQRNQRAVLLVFQFGFGLGEKNSHVRPVMSGRYLYILYWIIISMILDSRKASSYTENKRLANANIQRAAAPQPPICSSSKVETSRKLDLFWSHVTRMESVLKHLVDFIISSDKCTPAWIV
jgi:hypothetical protein